MRRLIAWICLCLALCGSGKAVSEDKRVFILCQPDSFVNVRFFPKMSSDVLGRMELGDSAYTDGRKKNGFLHISGMGFECDGWIYAGFVTDEITVRTEQMAVNRNKVACRRSIKGKRRKWLQEGDPVTVYAWSSDWAVTSQGFIMTEYLRGAFE